MRYLILDTIHLHRIINNYSVGLFFKFFLTGTFKNSILLINSSVTVIVIPNITIFARKIALVNVAHSVLTSDSG